MLSVEPSTGLNNMTEFKTPDETKSWTRNQLCHQAPRILHPFRIYFCPALNSLNLNKTAFMVACDFHVAISFLSH